MGYQLTAAELASYHNDGLVIPNTRLSPGLYEEIKDAVNGAIAATAKIKPDFSLVAHLPLRPGITEGIVGGDRIFRIATNPEILDLIGQALGPDIILWGTSLFAKPAGVGKKVQWHQDSYWWPMRPLVTCTMWIAVDAATPENGCLRYVPGSHKWDVMPHLDEVQQGLLGSCIQQDLLDKHAPRDVVLPAGGFSMHQANLVHGSEPNVSAHRRAGLVLRYMPATSHFDRSDAAHIEEIGVMKTGDVPKYGHRPIWLVRGQNRHPGNDFVRGHDGLADLDAHVGTLAH
jgi:hypothetical protein